MTKKKAETGMDRLKAMPLWQWGAIVIFAGMMANMLTGLVMPTPSGPAEARGQALGRGLVSVLALVVGLGMILRDVLRKKPESRKQAKKRKGTAPDL
jgi:hypothetical protein